MQAIKQEIRTLQRDIQLQLNNVDRVTTQYFVDTETILEDLETSLRIFNREFMKAFKNYRENCDAEIQEVTEDNRRMGQYIDECQEQANNIKELRRQLEELNEAKDGLKNELNTGLTLQDIKEAHKIINFKMQDTFKRFREQGNDFRQDILAQIQELDREMSEMIREGGIPTLLKGREILKYYVRLFDPQQGLIVQSIVGRAPVSSAQPMPIEMPIEMEMEEEEEEEHQNQCVDSDPKNKKVYKYCPKNSDAEMQAYDCSRYGAINGSIPTTADIYRIIVGYNEDGREPDGEDIARDLHRENNPNNAFKCEVMKRLDWLSKNGLIIGTTDDGTKATFYNTNDPVNKWYFDLLPEEDRAVPGEYNPAELWG